MKKKLTEEEMRKISLNEFFRGFSIVSLLGFSLVSMYYLISYDFVALDLPNIVIFYCILGSAFSIMLPPYLVLKLLGGVFK